MSVNEVLDPWLMLSGEEGPSPGERSKNGGIHRAAGKFTLLPGENCDGDNAVGWQTGSEGKGACHQAWNVQTPAPTWEKRTNNNPAIFLGPSQMGACVYTSTYIHNK